MIEAPGVQCHFLETAGAPADTGIGDTGVDAAEMGFGIGHGLNHLVFFADIHFPCRDPACAQFLQLRDGFLVGVRLADPDGDIGIRDNT